MVSRIARVVLPAAAVIAFLSSHSAFAAQSTENMGAQKSVQKADAPAAARDAAVDTAARPSSEPAADVQKGRTIRTLDGPICELRFDYDWWTGDGDIAYIKYQMCLAKYGYWY